MALDFMKIKVTNEPDISQIKEALNFRPEGYLEPVEPRYPFEVEKHGLTFKLYLKDNIEYIYITGSLHHFYNSFNFYKEQNYDDFTYTQMKVALYQLSDLINCTLRNMKVVTFEFGINIRSGIKPRYLINNMLYLNGKVVPTKEHYHKNGGIQKIFLTDSYCVKIYDKSAESALNKNGRLNTIEDLLRIEIIFKDSAYCQNYGDIYSLADFMSFEKVSNLYKHLIDHWNKILLVNSLKPDSTFLDEEKIQFNQWCVIDYFNDPNKVHFMGENRKRIYQYNKFVTFLDKKNYRSDYHDLTNIIEAKCKYLLHPDNEIIESIMKKIFDKEIATESLPKREIYEKLSETFGFVLTESEVVDISLIFEAITRLKDSGHI